MLLFWLMNQIAPRPNLPNRGNNQKHPDNLNNIESQAKKHLSQTGMDRVD
jgi:hypothetical protein